MSQQRRGRAFLALAAAWLAADHLTKWAVLRAFQVPGNHLTLLPGYLDLTLTYNRGAAFGLLDDHGWSRWLFVAIGAAALLAMVAWRHAIGRLPTVQRVGLALVAAGAAGNLLDRLFRGGQVVDFIHFHIASLGFVWPDFNVADIGVTCGMTLYVAHSLYTDLARSRAATGAPAPTPAAREEGDAA